MRGCECVKKSIFVCLLFQLFFQLMNTISSTIKYKFTNSKQTVTFLDVQIYLSETRKLRVTTINLLFFSKILVFEIESNQHHKTPTHNHLHQQHSHHITSHAITIPQRNQPSHHGTAATTW